MMEHFSTDFLVDYAHGELSPKDDALAHAHLADCAACRDEYDAEVSLGEMLRSSAVAEERELPAFLKAAVWEQIRAARPGPLARFTAFLRPAVAVPVGALILALAFVAAPLAHRGDAHPTIAASYYLQSHAIQSAQSALSERSSTVSDAFDSGYPATGALSGGR